MESCYKFHSCNAPLSPLDLNQGSHLTGEPICLGARELVKDHGTERVFEAFGVNVGTRLQRALSEYKAYHPDIKRKLSASATTRTKLKKVRVDR